MEGAGQSRETSSILPEREPHTRTLQPQPTMLNSVWYAKKMGRRIMGTLRRTKRRRLHLLVGLELRNKKKLRLSHGSEFFW